MYWGNRTDKTGLTTEHFVSLSNATESKRNYYVETHPMDSNIQLRKTEDGSPTLYSSAYDQTYHNPGGAVSESRHVFFEQSGLQQMLERGDSVTILEIGFGTGLNLLLTLDLYLGYGHNQSLTYHTIEAAPISTELAQSLDYSSFLRHPEQLDLLPDIFGDLQPGMNAPGVFDSLDLNIFVGTFNDYPASAIKADFIFHDAFSPDVNPELWKGETFQKLAAKSTEQAVLTTYCAASRARGAMCWAGWTVARAPGALGKREMSVASLDASLLEDRGLELVNNERLARRYDIGDFD